MAGLTTGSRISHFEVLQRLGEGGMGVVYKARDLRLDRLVALKVLSDHAASDPVRQARLVQEAKAASSLNHPHIVTVHEIDTVEGMTFIAMEHIEGRTLDQLIPQRGLRYTEVLKYGVQIAEGLAAAHAIGIIHRDVKPANIMVSGAGIAKVLDFGLAKQAGYPAPSPTGETVTIVAPLTRDGAIAGTVAYMSPEQAEGKPLDARSDIFSFGIVLYEMLTGRRPFAGNTHASTMAALMNQEPKPVRQIVASLPAEFDRIVSRCLRKDPAKRFQHMADLAVALAELKEESDSGTFAPAVPAKSARKLGWVLGVATVVVAVAGIWLATHRTSDPPQTVSTVTNYAGSELQPAFSPDGKQVAFSWDGEKGGNFDIYVKLLGETGALRLTTDPSTDSFPSWSPDGKRIIFRRFGQSGGIYSVSALGGGEQKLTSVPGNAPVSWSPDSKWLAIYVGKHQQQRPDLLILPAERGVPAGVSIPGPPVYNSRPAFLQSGDQVAYVRCEATFSCDIYVQQLTPDAKPRGEPRRITRQGLSIGNLAWSPDGSLLVYGAGATAADHTLWVVETNGDKPPKRMDIGGVRAFSPTIDGSGKRIVYSRNLHDIDLWRYREGNGVEAIIPSTATEIHPQFSPNGKQIAFQSDRGGSNEIWLANADGSQPSQLTNRVGVSQGTPRWSPDGRQIAFDSQGQDGQWDIFVIEAGGGQPVRLTAEPSDEYIPSWSRDGKWIYFCSTRTGRGEIWRSPSSGGQSEKISINGGNAAFESTDGRSLFFTRSTEADTPLIVRPLTGGPEEMLLPFASRAFQPTDQGIVFVGRSAEDPRPLLRFFDFATRKTRILDSAQRPLTNGLAVAPDGKTIVFGASQKTGSDLMMIENFRP